MFLNLRSSKITIPKSLIEELKQISKTRYPEEACAILFGNISKGDVQEIKISKVIELRNIVHSPVEFRWDEMEFYHHCLEQKKEALSFVGVFHSHPDKPYISEYDEDIILQTGKLYPELVWIVYGNQTQTFKAFIRISSTTINEIPINSRHN